jgi:hypothetical protein
MTGTALAAHVPAVLSVASLALALAPQLRSLALLAGLLAALRGQNGRDRAVMFTAFARALSGSGPAQRR